MKTIKQLQKEAKKAPSYVLKIEGLDLYLSDRQPNILEVNLTGDIKKAMRFSKGYDNEGVKVGAWTAVAQRMTNNKDVKFVALDL